MESHVFGIEAGVCSMVMVIGDGNAIPVLHRGAWLVGHLC